MIQLPYFSALFLWLKGLAVLAMIFAIVSAVILCVYFISAIFFDESDL